LFETDDTTPALFAGSEMKEEGRWLMGMIDGAVKGLNDLDTQVPVVQELGRREHPYTLNSRDRLANAYRGQGR